METESAQSGAGAWIKLRAAGDYRAFLLAYLEERSLSFADFARAAGFARGFPSDVVSGKRRLAAKSYQAFEKALKVPPPGKKLFKYLVALSEPDLFPELTMDRLPTLIREAREKSWTRSRRLSERDVPGAESLLADPNTSVVFSATGDTQAGASFEEIQRRTRLSAPILERLLANLESSKLIERREDRFVTGDTHLFIQGSDQKKLFSKIFERACAAAEGRAQDAWGSDAEFFFSSALCVQEDKMPALKKALRETVLSFVDDSIQTDGDRVVKLLVSLHK